MEAETVLARRPPLGSLLRAFIFLNIGLGPISAMVMLALTKKELFDPSLGGVFWARVGMMVAAAILALVMLVLVLRVASRWVMSRAGVYVRGADVVFNIPRREAWWHPTLTLEEKCAGLRTKPR